MPLTVNVGLSKKVGLPDYGSLGASVNVQYEMEAGVMKTDIDAFHNSVRNAFQACRTAVQAELERNAGRSNGSATEKPRHSHSNAQGNGHRATDKQLGYARTLAGQIRGMGIRRLDSLADKMFAKPLAELSTLEASSLIDTLKAIKEGSLKVEDALEGAGT